MNTSWFKCCQHTKKAPWLSFIFTPHHLPHPNPCQWLTFPSSMLLFLNAISQIILHHCLTLPSYAVVSCHLLPPPTYTIISCMVTSLHHLIMPYLICYLSTLSPALPLLMSSSSCTISPYSLVPPSHIDIFLNVSCSLSFPLSLASFPITISPYSFVMSSLMLSYPPA